MSTGLHLTWIDILVSCGNLLFPATFSVNDQRAVFPPAIAPCMRVRVWNSGGSGSGYEKWEGGGLSVLVAWITLADFRAIDLAVA